MTNKDVFKIWAPANKKWVDWVRPVPFVSINAKTVGFNPSSRILPCLHNCDKYTNDTAIIVDLPGAQSVEAGIFLAKEGYRPIPIFNGTMEQNKARATSDNRSILNALVWGASILNDIEINDNAPPSFLVDTNRLQRYKLDNSIFDNSWDVYHQDLPSEDYFLQNGISKILVISNDGVAKDLRKIFSNYPKKKISIFWTNGYEEPKCFKKGRKT